jgi:hypothetical protein
MKNWPMRPAGPIEEDIGSTLPDGGAVDQPDRR